MNTSLECMPCFMKMALREARLAAPGDTALHHDIVMEWCRRLATFDLNVPPPVIARHLAEMIEEKTGCGDLYVEDKREANETVMAMLPQLKAMLRDERDKEDGDPLALALELAIIGNYIDRGVELDVDWQAELVGVSGSLDMGIVNRFKDKVVPGATILMLGDNTGEIVLDMLLVEEMQRLECNVTYVVRSKPVINDATMDDAISVGMTDVCEVVESGVDTAGTVLERCSPAFLERMRKADVILSKGQGNFESLDGNWPGVFCAFKVKCKRVAHDSGLALGRSAFCITPVSCSHE